MRRRTFEEMITYFNQTVSGMDIDRKYKMTLLGIVTALLQKHDEDVAEMRDSVETARDIVHEAINNSVWSDAVDTAEMHKVVDDKYAEMTEGEG